jgi:tetratricopeptide (TPR) repeat protein
MKTLAVLLLLAAPALAAPSLDPAPSTGTVESVKLRLKINDPAAALAEAEAAVARTGAADAYAARADAKLAAGRPLDDVIADYREAAERDPKYAEKYEGLIVQKKSEMNPALGRKGGVSMPSGANGLAKVLGAAAMGLLIFIAALVLLRGRERPLAPPEEPAKKEPPREDV